MTNSSSKFPAEVINKLQFYVYRLIDPRNGETFYVGKGKANRVFAHIHAAVEGDEFENKLKRIHEIHLAGMEVGHVIHRHGMDEKTAFAVEAALIDAYPGLTNLAGGSGSDFGAMHAKEIMIRYAADEAKFRHKAILISINRTAADMTLYEATRYAWKLNIAKAKEAELVLATKQGLIVAAFCVDRWLPATPENFPARPEIPGRWGFVGTPAPRDLVACYVGKRVPDSFKKKGSANPIRYTWSKKNTVK